MLRLYYGDVSGLDPTRLTIPLSAYRMKKLARMKPAESKRQGIGAELLLILALRDLNGTVPLPLEINVSQEGKPYLHGASLHFNLSHSGSFSACAVSDHPIGIDLQARSSALDALMRRCFTEEERRLVETASDPDDLFTEIWTRKESYVKARGDGLRVPLSTFSGLNPPEPAAIWHSCFDNFHYSVCSLGGDPAPECIRRITLPL